MNLAQLQLFTDALNGCARNELREARQLRTAKQYRKGTLCSARAEAYSLAASMVSRLGLAQIAAPKLARTTPTQKRAAEQAKQWGHR